MSRSAAKFTFADGEVFYGLHCNTVSNYVPLFYRTKEERDELWHGWRDRHMGGKHSDDWDPCGCPGEAVTAGPEYDSEKYITVIEGKGCKEHGKYFGPYNDELPEEDYWTGWV
jgi:hypothetical protein